MVPHHKPKNITLTRISRLSKRGAKDSWFKPHSAADRVISGQHLGFEVAYQALVRIRGY